ncbi:hypothetical protein B0H13DRAFT_2385309 [Mycena leptocephala]|nr:hypothetical protein B0H13DRAFT_2385309 [Mycena leptocephala]
MSAATLELGGTLDNTMGSMLLGVIMSAILYGISLLQTLFYFTRQQLVLACPTNNLWLTGYDRDPVYLKALVAATVFLDTLHLSFVIHTMSHRNVLLTGAILLLVVATATCGTVWVVLALKAGTYESLLAISPLTLSINALSTAADVIITSTLCFILHRTRPVSLRTETMVNRLTHELMCHRVLISLIVSPTTLIYASFYFCIGRLYSNALLASLNARDIIRGHINDVDTNFKSQTYHARSHFRAK